MLFCSKPGRSWILEHPVHLNFYRLLVTTTATAHLIFLVLLALENPMWATITSLTRRPKFWPLHLREAPIGWQEKVAEARRVWPFPSTRRSTHRQVRARVGWKWVPRALGRNFRCTRAAGTFISLNRSTIRKTRAAPTTRKTPFTSIELRASRRPLNVEIPIKSTEAASLSIGQQV